MKEVFKCLIFHRLYIINCCCLFFSIGL